MTKPLRDSANQIMLYPMKDQYQKSCNIKLSFPEIQSSDVHLDYYGNQVGTFTHAQPHQELVH